LEHVLRMRDEQIGQLIGRLNMESNAISTLKA